MASIRAVDRPSDLDRDVRIALLRRFAEHGRAPAVADVAAEVGVGEEQVRASYRRLADEHVVVLAPGRDDVWMANPFSAVPTPFRVETNGRRYWGNCIWDGLGVLALLGDGTVSSPCPDCGEPITVEVRDGAPVTPGGAVVHFAVPAARWWENIAFT